MEAEGKNTSPNTYSLIEMEAGNCLTYSPLHATCFGKITAFLPNHVKASVNTNDVSAHGLPLHHYHLCRAPMVGQVVGQKGTCCKSDNSPVRTR